MLNEAERSYMKKEALSCSDSDPRTSFASNGPGLEYDRTPGSCRYCMGQHDSYG
jgi:hypothetical protein